MPFMFEIDGRSYITNTYDEALQTMEDTKRLIKAGPTRTWEMCEDWRRAMRACHYARNEEELYQYFIRGDPSNSVRAFLEDYKVSTRLQRAFMIGFVAHPKTQQLIAHSPWHVAYYLKHRYIINIDDYTDVDIMYNGFALNNKALQEQHDRRILMLADDTLTALHQFPDDRTRDFNELFTVSHTMGLFTTAGLWNQHIPLISDFFPGPNRPRNAMHPLDGHKNEIGVHVWTHILRPDWVWDDSWFTSTVAGLAQTIHTNAQFDITPILADALEEAGCDNPEILQHLRECTWLFKGDWVIDHAAGKR